MAYMQLFEHCAIVVGPLTIFACAIIMIRLSKASPMNRIIYNMYEGSQIEVFVFITHGQVPEPMGTYSQSVGAGMDLSYSGSVPILLHAQRLYTEPRGNLEGRIEGSCDF